MSTLSNNFVAICAKSSKHNYYCELCDYTCFKKYNWNKHLNTQKHVNAIVVNKKVAKSGKSGNKLQNNLFTCENCGKEYNDRSGLWRHKKKCNSSLDNIQEKENNKEEPTDKELIMMLIKENSELKNMIMKVLENGTHNTTNNTTHTNSHNKAFNLQFFLNETCKNAMNITDFVDSIKLQLSDFISIGDVGFVEGISNIIVKNLNSLDETVRPIHCTDQKRETFYLKDQNIWEKDDDDKKRMKQMIKSISYKNEKLIKTYKETYPDYNDSDSRRSDQYSKIMVEAMDCKEESREKIIKNISKATIIKNK
jgi:hypothetical protein